MFPYLLCFVSRFNIKSRSSKLCTTCMPAQNRLGFRTAGCTESVVMVAVVLIAEMMWQSGCVLGLPEGCKYDRHEINTSNYL